MYHDHSYKTLICTETTSVNVINSWQVDCKTSQASGFPFFPKLAGGRGGGGGEGGWWSRGGGWWWWGGRLGREGREEIEPMALLVA